MTKQDWIILRTALLYTLASYLLVSLIYKLTHWREPFNPHWSFWGGVCIGLAIGIYYKPFTMRPVINLMVVVMLIGAGIGIFSYVLMR